MAEQPFAKNAIFLVTAYISLTGVLQQYFVHVSAGVLEELVVAVEDDDRDLAVAQNAQLVGLASDNLGTSFKTFETNYWYQLNASRIFIL